MTLSVYLQCLYQKKKVYGLKAETATAVLIKCMYSIDWNTGASIKQRKNQTTLDDDLNFIIFHLQFSWAFRGNNVKFA